MIYLPLIGIVILVVMMITASITEYRTKKNLSPDGAAHLNQIKGSVGKFTVPGTILFVAGYFLATRLLKATPLHVALIFLGFMLFLIIMNLIILYKIRTHSFPTEGMRGLRTATILRIIGEASLGLGYILPELVGY